MNVTHRTKLDLTEGLKETRLSDIYVTEQKNAHTIIVEIVNNGQPVDLSGATVSGYFNRNSTKTSVPIKGTAEGNAVSVTLPQACYIFSGSFYIDFGVSYGGVYTTVFYGVGNMRNNRFESVVDPENVVPSLDDILAQLDLMRSATESANSAAEKASNAANDIENFSANAKTVAPNEKAAVKVTKTEKGFVADFDIPQGAQGAKGDKGDGNVTFVGQSFVMSIGADGGLDIFLERSGSNA